MASWDDFFDIFDEECAHSWTNYELILQGAEPEVIRYRICWDCRYVEELT